MTAGLAPIHRSSEEVYRATYRRMAERSREFHSWYPEDAERAGRIADLLAGREVLLPDGSPLSPERFQSVGMLLGGTGHRLGGSVLRAADLVRGHGIPLLAVNLGHVGFLAEIDRDDMDDAMRRVIAGARQSVGARSA